MNERRQFEIWRGVPPPKTPPRGVGFPHWIYGDLGVWKMQKKTGDADSWVLDRSEGGGRKITIGGLEGSRMTPREVVEEVLRRERLSQWECFHRTGQGAMDCRWLLGQRDGFDPHPEIPRRVFLVDEHGREEIDPPDAFRRDPVSGQIEPLYGRSRYDLPEFQAEERAKTKLYRDIADSNQATANRLKIVPWWRRRWW